MREAGSSAYIGMAITQAVSLAVGVSAVEVKAPRVSDVAAELSAAGFESKIVKRYERTSRQTQDLFRKLCMEE